MTDRASRETIRMGARAAGSAASVLRAAELGRGDEREQVRLALRHADEVDLGRVALLLRPAELLPLEDEALHRAAVAS